MKADLVKKCPHCGLQVLLFKADGIIMHENPVCPGFMSFMNSVPGMRTGPLHAVDSTTYEVKGQQEMPLFAVQLDLRVERGDDGKYYGALFVNGSAERQSTGFATMKEARDECAIMERMLKEEIPPQMAAKGYRVEFHTVGLA